MAVFSAVRLCMALEGETLLGLALLAMALCVAWTRSYLGIHFPLDMLAAIGRAARIYALVVRFWQRLGGRATLLVERAYVGPIAWPISREWVRP